MSSKKSKAKLSPKPATRSGAFFSKILYPILAGVVIISLLVVFFTGRKHGAIRPISDSGKITATIEFSDEGELRFLSGQENELARIRIEVADNPTDITLGLMFRDKMSREQGMLFIFPEEEPRAFWMKNTILSLDMIFADSAGKIVTIHENTVPFSEESYISSIAARYVVEVNAGFVNQHDIKIGDLIAFQLRGESD